MNKTKIEWCDYTWNPVTGCLHKCEYCYARRIAKRFGKIDDSGIIMKYSKGGELSEPLYYQDRNGEMRINPYPYKFFPTFHKYRLNEPQQVKKPSKIFVSSMGDLFGEWVPDEWIEQVMNVVKQCPQHTFIFLTKNPYRYYNWFGYDIENIPQNCWIGASADNANDTHVRSEELAFMKATVRFISFEPLFDDVVEYVDWDALDWVIVGAQTGPGRKETRKEWVENILSYAEAYNIPVFLKDNLNWPEKIQKWPKMWVEDKVRYAHLESGEEG